MKTEQELFYEYTNTKRNVLLSKFGTEFSIKVCDEFIERFEMYTGMHDQEFFDAELRFWKEVKDKIEFSVNHFNELSKEIKKMESLSDSQKVYILGAIDICEKKTQTKIDRIQKDAYDIAYSNIKPSETTFGL